MYSCATIFNLQSGLAIFGCQGSRVGTSSIHQSGHPYIHSFIHSTLKIAINSLPSGFKVYCVRLTNEQKISAMQMFNFGV